MIIIEQEIILIIEGSLAKDTISPLCRSILGERLIVAKGKHSRMRRRLRISRDIKNAETVLRNKNEVQNGKSEIASPK